MCKILALYLPQFHQIPENDEWWGEGFTEWNVVKKAKAINRNVIQPRIPKDGYYDLSKVENIRRQVELANKYGIDGFVMYSYYSNGKTLLQKPADIVLNNPDINISFCFSWANHDWMRTWFEYNRELLRKQEYASNVQQIKEHFYYLLPYFKDSRYIMHDNKPVMFIYSYESFPDFDVYKKTWNELAIEEGFSGIFFVQTLGGHNYTWNRQVFDACFDFEPTYTTFSQMQCQHAINRIKRGIKHITKGKWITNYFDYNKVCRFMEKRVCEEPNHFLGMFAEWDNTPRHSHNGTVFTNFTIERFKQCFKSQLQKSIKYKKPFLVIDAWNEWGEGAYLEPDNIYGYGKLEAIRSCIDEIRINQ